MFKKIKLKKIEKLLLKYVFMMCDAKNKHCTSSYENRGSHEKFLLFDRQEHQLNSFVLFSFLLQ